MRLSFITAILLAIPYFGAGNAARADELSLQALSNEELGASVAGVSLAIDYRADTQNNQSDIFGIGGNRLENFTGLQTISVNIGTDSVSQADTSLAVRASLANGLALARRF